ncbi:MAG: hypothetical protein ACYTGX_06180 [Planctomycetota bacterium]|jgi:hypothetical protein
MVAADYLRWLHRQERFTVREVRRYLGRLSLIDGALILFLFSRLGGRGAMAGDSIVDVVDGLHGSICAFRRDPETNALRLYVRRAGWLERAVLPAYFHELSRTELRHLLVADLTRRGARYAKQRVICARTPPPVPQEDA